MRPGCVLPRYYHGEDPSPAKWTGQQAVVTLSRHIDNSNVDQIRERPLQMTVSRARGGHLAARAVAWRAGATGHSCGQDLISQRLSLA